MLTSGNKVSQNLIPIEVKPSKTYKTDSLDNFKKVYKGRIDASYIIHPKDFSIKEDGTICLPIYMTFAFKKAKYKIQRKNFKNALNFFI